MQPIRKRTLTLVTAVLCSAAVTCPSSAAAQAVSSGEHAPLLDFALTYQTVRADNNASGAGSFFLQGGAAEVRAHLYRGFGLVASVTGETAGGSTTGGSTVTFISTVFGPRYTFAAHKRVSPFLEGMVGEANGFNGSYRSSSDDATVSTSANGLAALAGGGVDIALSRRFAVRAVQADWLRTQLPNGANNVQNSLRLGAGVVMRFR